MEKQNSKRVLILAATVAGVFSSGAAPASTPTQWVNPLIGTDPNPVIREGYGWDTGNVFPGAVCPRGMVAWSPDTTHQREIAGGYWYPDREIEGFSLTHFSGRGVVCLKDIPFMPVIQPVSVSPGTHWKQFAAAFSHANETAAPGYYRVKLDDGIQAEFTVTPRTGMARFTFPAAAAGTLLIRAGESVAINGREVTGVCSNNIGGGKRPYLVYFAAQFDRPFQSAGTWSGGDLRAGNNVAADNCGAILTFDPAAGAVVQARVGISYVSLEDARDNLARENPGWDFDRVKQQADAQWNAVLNRIQVEGGTHAEKTAFYTALYHCFMHPNLLDDVNGRYPGMDGKIHSVAAGHHQYQNIPAWDQYRSLAPLMALLVPAEDSDIVQSLVNYAQQDAGVRPAGGGLPRWQQVNRNSGGMVGDGDDAIIATAYAFGANQFDTAAALAAMDKGASQPGTTSDGFEVRRGLADDLKLGYVPDNVAVTLEYCVNDFALSRFAAALGDREKQAVYQNRAQNWKNLFDDSTRLLRPRDLDGSWAANFSPTTKKGFTEGTAGQYVWMVNFNLGGLIDRLGGVEKTAEQLDQFFTNVNSGIGSAGAYMGNEPCEETPWVYDYVSKPARTQEVVRRIQRELFTATPGGLPGNDDAGALSSWLVFSYLGIYPEIPGVAGFVLGSPVFPKAAIHLENGATIEIIGRHASTDNCYVQRLELNGHRTDNLWVPWSALSIGGVLDFSLGSRPSAWGSGANSPPPSFDTAKPE